MTDKTPRVFLCSRWLLPSLVLVIALLAGCSSTSTGRYSDNGETKRTANARAENDAKASDTAASDSSQPNGDQGKASQTSAQKLNSPKAQQPSDIDMLEAEDDSETYDAASEDFWTALNQAEEFYTMGCIANRDGAWEEAQYYFEKSIKALSSIDYDSDSVLTPEAVKYNTLLDNIIADYRVTLRSLGRLDEDADPSAIVQQFNDIEERLDSMVITRGETPPVTYDLPIVQNDRVKKSIVYFQTVANEAFARYLRRSQKYSNFFKGVLNQYGLPHDLIYLCLVESGYNPHAYSWARAMGLWQFIASTGKLYGLERNWWVDERKDPVKATHAAARFLKDLYDKFGSWDLAMAAYNGGPGRVSRTIAAQGTNDFWKLRLRQQTMDYVPLIYAATIIAKEPEKYGFTNIEYEPELLWDEVTIGRSLELREVANVVGCSLEEIKSLNPELLRNVTPPNTSNYTLKIPIGTRDKFMAAYETMPAAKATQFARHKVKRGETVGKIAQKYGVSQYALLEANNLSKKSKLKAGQSLIIPGMGDAGYGRKTVGNSGRSKDSYPTKGSIYTVRSGDTMWDIAKAFGISTDELRRLNYMKPNAKLKVGQAVKIPSHALAKRNDATESPAQVTAPEQTTQAAAPRQTAAENTQKSSGGKSAKTKVYIVKRGDTISGLAQRFGMTTSQLRKLNNLGSRSKIVVGQKMKVVEGGASADYVVHQVKRGDTLGRIAQQYNTSVSRIIANNGSLNPRALQVGDEIKIYVE